MFAGHAVLLGALALGPLSAAGEVLVFDDEAAYRAAAASRGYAIVEEGFEDDAVWGDLRSTIADGSHTAPSVASQGVVYAANNASSGVTTGPGPARTGEWGFFELPHGDFASGISDGWLISAAAGPLFGVGAWIETNTPFAELGLLVGGEQPVDLPNPLLDSTPRFFGVIDTAGMAFLELKEVEAQDELEFLFADDFTVALPEPGGAPWVALLSLTILRSGRVGRRGSGGGLSRPSAPSPFPRGRSRSGRGGGSRPGSRATRRAAARGG
jgi:hypothetical protein